MLVMFLLSTKANAEVVPDTVGVHVGSVHFPQQDFNNVNPGIYLAGSINNVPVLPDGRYVVGAYYNSIKRGSLYVAYVYPICDWADVTVGLITGYNREGDVAKPVMPMVVPSVHFPIFGDFRGRVHFAPRFMKTGANAFHFSIERRF
jgi:hypothetical protein